MPPRCQGFCGAGVWSAKSPRKLGAPYFSPSLRDVGILTSPRHYVYAVLHHPDYRQRYAANLCHELPRIPFVGACHPEAAESFASRATPNEGPMQLGGNAETLRPLKSIPGPPE